jgi:glutamine synthetase
MKLQIESRTIGDISQNHIIPTAIKYQNTLISNIKGLNDVLPVKEAEEASKTQLKLLRDTSQHLNAVKIKVDNMIEARKRANDLKNPRDKAIAYCDEVKPYFDEIKYHVDKLEMLIDDELWPLPKLREVLFTK